MREIKGQIESSTFRAIFGDWRTDHDWSQESITIAPRTAVKKESSITCSGIGAGKTGMHYDVIIMDDLNSAENSNTLEARAKIIDHYRMNHAILEPGGIMVVIGTRYAQDDVIGHILDTECQPEKEGLLNGS